LEVERQKGRKTGYRFCGKEILERQWAPTRQLEKKESKKLRPKSDHVLRRAIHP